MWPNPQFPADLVTFTQEILNRKIHFLYSGSNLVNQSLPNFCLNYPNITASRLGIWLTRF